MAGGIGTALGIFDSAWSAMRCNNIATRGPACATARGESAGSPASSTAPPAKTTASSVSFACPAVRQASCISRSAATAPSTLPAGFDPAGVELCRQRPRPRAAGGEIQRDRIARVDQTEIGVQEPDQAALTLDLGFDRLLAQQ